MAYFADLSDYTYTPDNRPAITRIGWLGLSKETPFPHPRVKNIGWLAKGHEFPIQPPSEEMLDLLWLYCAISVNQMRGIQPCVFCKRIDEVIPPHPYAERNGQKKLLGSAEIRVFSNTGDAYAAPTLIFHYVSAHHYRPPTEFIETMRSGPQPPSENYFRRLNELGLEWNKSALPKPL